MKIAVYGDSFACVHPDFKSACAFAWFNLLQELLPESSITSYGKGASSVYYSYKKFLETHDQYDIIIFLVTEPNRYPKEYLDSNNNSHHFHSLAGIEHFMLTNKSMVDTRFLENLKGWFIMNDDEYALDMSELMLKDIENIRPNTIFFPCFTNSMIQERMDKCDNISMFKILHMQFDKLNAVINVYDTMRDNDERLSCHFTPEFNKAIANSFAKRISTGQWNWNDLNNITLTNDLNYYYVKRK